MMSSNSSSDHFPIGVLSAKDGLMLFFTLPTVAPEEIEGMVRLQAEELSPYPIERTCIAWEKVWEDASQCRVVVALCNISKLDYYHESPQNDVDRIDVDLLACWEGILKNGDGEDGTKGFHLILIDEDLYLVAADEKGLCMTWTLQSNQDVTVEDLEEDITLATTSLTTAVSGLDASRVSLWHEDDPPEWVHALDQETGGRTYTLKPLPDMGEGLEARTWEGAHLDLMPVAWKEKKSSKAKQKKFLTAAGILLTLWGLGIGAVIGRNIILARRLENAREANTQSSTEQVIRLKDQVETLRPFVNRRTSALDSLLTIAQAMPNSGSLVINRFQYSKGNSISCGGVVKGRENAFTAFLENLTANEDLNVLRYDLKQGSREVTFQIDFEWLNEATPMEAAL